MTNVQEDLEDALAGESPDFEEAPRPALDLTQATEWVSEVARVRRLRNEYVEAHQAAIARLNERMEQRLRSLNEQEEWFAEALAMYHRTVIANDEKALTIHTPAGTLKSNKGQPAWTYDDAKLIPWVVENMNDLAEFPPPPDPKVNKANLKKALKEAKISDGIVLLDDGTAVPGVTVQNAKRTFTVVTD